MIHHFDPLGLIDRDYREDKEVASLDSKGIKVLGFHELEHLLLLESVITEVARSLGRDDAKVIMEAIKSRVFKRVEREVEMATAKLAASRIHRRLAGFGTKDIKDNDSLNQRFTLFMKGIDPQVYYKRAEKDIQNAGSATEVMLGVGYNGR